MIGKTISRYKILEKLGEGGMGIVYKAEDMKLRRIVALKFLPPHSVGTEGEKTRFLHEAQAAASLSHPNICTIHEIDESEGQIFIAMECIEGHSLKDRIDQGPLKLDEASSIAVQIAEGLEEAHRKGIIHRDVKPANIMVTARGQVKIMDFGLAKAGGRTVLTKTGTTLGTVAYMSPEQARGEEIDARSDIWSLGAVLYEMLAGQVPFKGTYEQAVVYLIMNRAPEPLVSLRPEIPRELGQIVEKALVKNVKERYQDAGRIKEDLESLRDKLKSGELGGKRSVQEAVPSIAVLPFVDMSPGKDQEYFCEGMAENIINALTKLESLRVVARTSAFAFKGEKLDIRDIGRKLNVESVLEGSIQKAGNRLRITTQLINVADGYHLWSEKYDRDMEGIFAIQDEISLAIVDKLKVKLLKDEKAGVLKHHTDDIEAHDLCLKGLYYSRMLTVAGYDTAVKCLEQAIQKDPSYALAFGGLALVYFSRTYWGYMPPQEGYPKSRAYAKKALELDPTIGEPHAMLGYNSAFYDWDWTSAEREFKQALDLAPKSSIVHTLYSDFLTITSRHEEAVTEAELALELDPLSEYVNANLGLKLWFSERYDEAMEPLQKALKLNPNHFYPHLVLSYGYASKEMYKEAMAEIERAVDLSGEHPWAVSILALTLHQVGQVSQSEELFSRLLERSKKEYVPPMCFVNASIACGDLDRAYDWVRRACESRDSFLCWVRVAPSKAVGIPDEPRFTELLKTMGPGSR